MVVLTNRRLGPGAELIVSPEVGRAMLHATALAARALASSRWECELADWLERRAEAGGPQLDVSEIAWTPEHFEAQRQFAASAVARAATSSEHAGALVRWQRLIEGHPRDSVQVGRRWQWAATG
ncbi:MAG TPA: hypothetical protein VLX92_33685 [Kofleriaceae bacterium]|nr:hypothetical protein [Kofleriaceae bacterium]